MFRMIKMVGSWRFAIGWPWTTAEKHWNKIIKKNTISFFSCDVAEANMFGTSVLLITKAVLLCDLIGLNYLMLVHVSSY